MGGHVFRNTCGILAMICSISVAAATRPRAISKIGLFPPERRFYLRRERFRPERFSYDLTVATLAFALTANLAILVQLTLVTGASPSLTSLSPVGRIRALSISPTRWQSW